MAWPEEIRENGGSQRVSHKGMQTLQKKNRLAKYFSRQFSPE